MAGRMGRPARGRPTRITAVLTERCHLRCSFCSLWDQPDSGARVEEWIQLFEANPFLEWVNLTGGEIFAKQRLSGLLEAMVRALPGLNLLDFPTAGQQPERVVRVVEQLLKTRIPHLVVTVSIDGPQPLHDELRGVPGAFEKALDTYRQLHAIRNRRFRVVVGCTLTDQARSQADGLHQALTERVPGFNPDDIHFNLAHHSSHYYKNTSFDALPDDQAVQVLEQRRFFRAGPVGWAEWVYARTARQSLQEGFPTVGCQAAEQTVFVAPDLTVYPCSIWDQPLGNLREFQYQLEALLTHLPAVEARQSIQRKECPGCFTPCEALPAMLSRPIKATWLAMRNGHS